MHLIDYCIVKTESVWLVYDKIVWAIMFFLVGMIFAWSFNAALDVYICQFTLEDIRGFTSDWRD